jgi:hypothetical protein
MGGPLMEEYGFAKAVVQKGTGTIFHTDLRTYELRNFSFIVLANSRAYELTSLIFFVLAKPKRLGTHKLFERRTHHGGS